MTIKQYAAFLQQNPNMTQEYAMDVLKKTRPQLKRIERVAGVKLKKCTLYNADKINDLDIVIVWCALNATKPTLKKVIYFIRQQLGIELSHYKLKQKLAKFGLLIENIKDQQQHYINKFESEHLK